MQLLHVGQTTQLPSRWSDLISERSYINTHPHFEHLIFFSFVGNLPSFIILILYPFHLPQQPPHDCQEQVIQFRFHNQLFKFEFVTSSDLSFSDYLLTDGLTKHTCHVHLHGVTDELLLVRLRADQDIVFRKTHTLFQFSNP